LRRLVEAYRTYFMNSIISDQLQVNGVHMSGDSMFESLLQLEDAVENENQLIQHWVRPDTLPKLKKHKALKNALDACDLIHSDSGIFCALSTWRSGKSLPTVASQKVIANLIRLADDNGYRVFFLGSRFEIVSNLAAHYSNETGSRTVCGFHHGMYRPEDEQSIAEQIADSGAQIVITDMDVVTQVNFTKRHAHLLSRVNVFTGHSGVFDKLTKYEGLFKQSRFSYLWEGLENLGKALQKDNVVNKFRATFCLLAGAIH
jgi:N-acetylglucosaminyldiphosphoundecaprenol N-acetyl-beta-D-mannosaminyltransferase